ncbi:MAG: N-acetyltransferase [Rhodospirillales bacterium]|nr:N-acetyltransferase [Rhodospirillales bacterium]
MFDITTERPHDAAPIESLLDRAFGSDRLAKVSYRYRDGVAPDPWLRLVARRGAEIVGSIRYWPVMIAGAGETPALLLGPLAVEAKNRGLGIGRGLVRQSLDMAAWARHRVVVLVGEPAYYAPFGFRPAPAGIVMPGEDPARLQAHALVPGALDGLHGVVRPWRGHRGDGTGLAGAGLDGVSLDRVA